MINRSAFEREKLLYSYLQALDEGHLEKVAEILQQAQFDPDLNRMILEAHEALDHAAPEIGSVLTPSSYQNGKNSMTHAHSLSSQSTLPGPALSPRRIPALTLVAALLASLLLVGLLIGQQINREPANVGLAMPVEQGAESRLDIFNRYIEIWSSGEASRLNEVVTDEHVLHGSFDEGPVRGRSALAAEVLTMHRDVDELTFRIEAINESEDGLWASLTFAFQDFVASDNPVFRTPPNMPIELPVYMIVRFEGDLIAETTMDLNATNLMWVLMDSMGVDDFTGRENQLVDLTRGMMDDLWNNPDADADTVRKYYFRSFDFWLGWPEAQPIAPGEWYLGVLTPMRAALPDMTLTLHSVSAEQDTVMVHYTASGTWSADLCLLCDGTEPIPPTGETLTWKGSFVYRFNEENLIVEESWYMDMSFILTLGSQAGILQFED